MDWRVKAALCRGLSLPGGRALHRFAQQRLTRSVTNESRMVLDEEIKAVRRMPLADRFAGYELEDLAARHGHYLLRPA